MKRELKIDMIALDSAFESGMDMFAFYLDAETGKIASVSDDDRFTLEQIYESFISRMCCWITKRAGALVSVQARAITPANPRLARVRRYFPHRRRNGVISVVLVLNKFQDEDYR